MARGFQLLETFTEIESGKHDESQRPVLTAALEVARKQGAPIIVAKLDRLSRDVHYISVTGLWSAMPPTITDWAPTLPSSSNFKDLTTIIAR